LKVRVEGQLVFNNIAMRLDAALKGLGLAYMPEDLVQTHLAEGQLIRVLSDWCEPFSGISTIRAGARPHPLSPYFVMR
jgi:DNA-binding transcriptional LysR family regulator